MVRKYREEKWEEFLWSGISMETIKFIILQMPKVSIKVVVRVRPITKLITLISNTDKTISLKQPKSNKTYKFDHVCGPHTTQEQLHQEAGIA